MHSQNDLYFKIEHRERGIRPWLQIEQELTHAVSTCTIWSLYKLCVMLRNTNTNARYEYVNRYGYEFELKLKRKKKHKQINK